jgi:hypothetical protein
MAQAKNLIILLAGFLLLIPACKDNTPGDEKPMARVNDFVITEKDFRREISTTVRFRQIMGLTMADKREFLDGQIRKELLIQVATSQGLDKEDGFREAIERFWEQTLITTLLRREGARLEREIIVTREEMKDRHGQMLEKNPLLPPFEEALPELEREIREMKKTKALEAWVEGLWKDGKITIYEENLKALK